MREGYTTGQQSQKEAEVAVAGLRRWGRGCEVRWFPVAPTSARRVHALRSALYTLCSLCILPPEY